ncbi:unnamed protein product [Anisakis simplex]|uniref:Reverse transcriptase domain-containing protein n=1 Tax=Anisakis simplex TaxID=6269 RepID=A0A0M3J2N3_ANISI|nr:unnamed protein product [Anisakis simplex]
MRIRRINQLLNGYFRFQLCTSGWELVSSGFAQLLNDAQSRITSLDTTAGVDQEFFSQFTINELFNDVHLSKRFTVLINKLSPNLTTLTVNAAVFSKMLQNINNGSLLFPYLRSLHICVGNQCGSLSSQVSCAQSRWLAAELKSVKVTVNLSEKSPSEITCCDFKTLLKLLSQIIGSAGTWSLCLKDATQRAQGWFSPAELSQNRHTSFVSYVRAALDTGVALHSLELFDELKMSPYMIVMQKQRRLLYMYDEFKKCERLVIGYDIGIVAPSFHAQQSTYSQLKFVELVASHVLCKKDFVVYLSDARS